MSADVITWLRSGEGEAWSRGRHEGRSLTLTEALDAMEDAPGPQWRPDGPLGTGDPCGAGPVKSGGRS